MAVRRRERKAKFTLLRRFPAADRRGQAPALRVAISRPPAAPALLAQTAQYAQGAPGQLGIRDMATHGVLIPARGH
jgi:hypothetical protein